MKVDAKTIQPATPKKLFMVSLFILTGAIAASSISGCQKNSYDSCVDFQTEAARRAVKRNPEIYTNEQETVDDYVSRFCANVR